MTAQTQTRARTARSFMLTVSASVLNYQPGGGGHVLYWGPFTMSCLPMSLCLSVTSSLDLSHILQSIKVLIIYKNTSMVYSLQTTPSYQQCSKHNLAVGQTFVSHHHHLRVDQIKARFITWNVLFLYSVFLMSAGV